MLCPKPQVREKWQGLPGINWIIFSTARKSGSSNIFLCITWRAAEKNGNDMPRLNIQLKDQKAERNVDEQCLHRNLCYAVIVIGQSPGPGDECFQSSMTIGEAQFVDFLMAKWANGLRRGWLIYSAKQLWQVLCRYVRTSKAVMLHNRKTLQGLLNF